MSYKLWSTNRTGIRHLSIGKSKNRHGGYSSRYSVNHVVDDKTKCKSFNFSDDVSQKEAFKSAIQYMREQKIYDETVATALAIYTIKDHQSLLS